MNAHVVLWLECGGLGHGGRWVGHMFQFFFSRVCKEREWVSPSFVMLPVVYILAKIKSCPDFSASMSFFILFPMPGYFFLHFICSPSTSNLCVCLCVCVWLFPIILSTSHIIFLNSCSIIKRSCKLLFTQGFIKCFHRTAPLHPTGSLSLLFHSWGNWGSRKLSGFHEFTHR